MTWDNFNLRTLLIGTIGLLSVLVVSVSGLLAFNAWQDGRVARQVVELNKVADALLLSRGEIIAERDLVAEFVTTGSSSTAGVAVAVSERTDAGWQKALAVLKVKQRGGGAGTPGNGVVNFLQAAETAHGAFAQARSHMIRELKKPIGDRDGDVVRAWYDTAARAIDASASLRRAVARQANAVDSATQTFSLLKGLTLNITDFAGRESMIIADAMFNELPLSPRQVRILYDYRGRMELAWATLSETVDTAAIGPDVRAAVASVQNQFIGQFGAARKANYDAGISAKNYPLSAKQWLSRTREAVSSLVGLRDALIKANQVHARDQNARASRLLAIVSLLLLLGLAATVASVMIIARRVIKPIVQLTGTTGVLAAGDMDSEIPGRERQDEIGAMARSLEQIRALGIDAARSQAAVNDASSAILMTDLDGQVIFANKAMKKLHGQLSEPLGALPGFSAERIVGKRFEELHDVAVLGAANLTNLDRQVDVRLVKGGRTIDLKVGPVLNEQGERLGTVVEWSDRSQEVAIENEVSGIVMAAVQGDFSKRLDEAGKAGFMLELTKGMNELVDTVDRGLSETVEVMAGLADGDLAKRMSGDYKGNFQQLKDDVNRTSDQLRQIAGQIATTSASVDGATGEIASGVTDLSTRTEHQASSLEETTASMEELSATVRQNADNAQEANQVAAAARQSATNGGEVVSNAVAAMSRIEDSSKQITEIVGLIQEIAFQTNLLALNAAVEAARAGDAGRGFAVVANEVRALAQRAGQASKDIQGLITNSDNQVREGVELVNKAGASLEEIVGSVKKVADFVSEIAAASQEQSSGIDQVSRAINSMEEMTQQNGALVEETTAALQSAQSQVGSLREVVTFFKTGEVAGHPAQAGPVADDQDTNEGLVNPVRQQPSRLRSSVVSGSAAAHSTDNFEGD